MHRYQSPTQRGGQDFSVEYFAAAAANVGDFSILKLHSARRLGLGDIACGCLTVTGMSASTSLKRLAWTVDCIFACDVVPVHSQGSKVGSLVTMHSAKTVLIHRSSSFLFILFFGAASSDIRSMALVHPLMSFSVSRHKRWRSSPRGVSAVFAY